MEQRIKNKHVWFFFYIHFDEMYATTDFLPTISRLLSCAIIKVFGNEYKDIIEYIKSILSNVLSIARSGNQWSCKADY